MIFFQQLYEEEASMAGFEPGERVKAKDLLYGVLLPSGAECCRDLCREHFRLRVCVCQINE